jgi:hypothetical protein
MKKYFIVAALIIGAFIAGTFYKRPDPGSVQTVYKDRIVTVTKTITKKPDGTIISETETKTENKSGTKVETKLPRYSAGILVVKSLSKSKLVDRPDYGLSGGIRLLGSLWAEMQVIPVNQTVALGLRLEF